MPTAQLSEIYRAEKKTRATDTVKVFHGVTGENIAYISKFERALAAQGCATSARKTRILEPLRLMLRAPSKREAAGHANALFTNDLVHDHEHD